jgi:MtfA peptidase
MSVASVILIVIILLVIAAYWFDYIRSVHSRPRKSEFRFSEHAEEVIKKDVRIYSYLPSELQDKLKLLVEEFVDSVRFEASGGLPEVSERVKIGIAAQASLLLLGWKRRRYKFVRQVLVYPGELDGLSAAGHAYPTGSVTVGLQSARAGGKNPKDGVNVVIHEFAHHLDFENPLFAGIPFSYDVISWIRWVRCLRSEHGRLKRKEDTSLLRVLRKHPNWEDPRELFAHSVEQFFERPHQLFREHRELYELLRRYFQQNPRTLLPEP